METLPIEILEKIYRDERLDYVDLSRLSSVCRRFKEIADSNENWMLKFKLSYPKLFDKIPVSKLSKLSWKQELKKRIKFKSYVREEVESMSEKFFNKTELAKSDLHMFDDILVQHHHDRSNVHLYITDELANLIHRTDRLEDMTTKYYASKCIQHVKHSILRPQVASWPQMEEGRLTYQDILITIAQWSQPTLDISTRDISGELDLLASRILSDLEQSSPGHPIFRKIREEQEIRNEASVDLSKLPNFNCNLTENVWSSQDSKEILKSANNVLYDVEGFVGNHDDYYNADNSYINCLLENKRGIPISLCLLYSSLLSRLGVLCLPVNFPGHFLLKWLEHPEEQDPANRFTFIDAFNGGREMTGHQARNMSPQLSYQDEYYQVAGPLAVAQRMLRNLISIGASRSNNMRDPSYSLLRSSLELMLILNTSDTMQYGFMLSRVYLQLNINHEDVMSMLQEYRDIPGIGDQVDYLMSACQAQIDERRVGEPEPEVKRREERGVPVSFPFGQVSLRVGQVCRHRKYNYVCVIYGWDTHCKASKNWISQMGVDKLDQKDKQPFYNVLVSDGSNRYAAQENISPIKPEEVTHPEVGKYFQSFNQETGYIANSQLEKAYPDENH